MQEATDQILCDVCLGRKTLKKRLHLNSITSLYPNELWQWDFYQIITTKDDPNRKYLKDSKYLLNIVCVGSRRGWSYIHPNRLTSGVVNDFDKTIDIYGELKKVQGDNAEEFDSKNLREFLDSHDIAIGHGPTYCPTAQSYVERFNRTMAELITVVFLRATPELKNDFEQV